MSSSEEHPRVLIVAANPISQVQSVGLMMRSIFTGWPRDRLAQIYFPLFHAFPPDTGVCPQTLRVNSLGLTREIAASPDAAASAGRQSSGTASTTASRPLDRMVHRVTRTQRFRAPLVDPLREALAAYPWLDPLLVAYARRFRPDVVYSTLGTIRINRAAAVIARELDLPVVPHITDNWLETRFVGSPFGASLRRRLRFWLDEVMLRAPLVLAVSGVMARDYGDRFGKPGHALTTLVEEAPYLSARAEPDAPPDDGGVRLVYAGNLGLERWRILRLVGQGLEILRAEGVHGRLDVYCSNEHREHYRRALEIDGVLRVREWVPVGEVPRLLVGADVLVHAESPDPAVLDFTRHSFSTKLSQYMMAGRCTLLVGPAEAGAVREVSRTGGAVIAEPALDSVTDTLRRLLTDDGLRERMGDEARRVAHRHFEASRHRERFRGILATVAGGGAAGRVR